MASLLTGTSVPIDFGDGAGMNLLDLARGAWSPQLLDATAPSLGRKLKPAVPSATLGRAWSPTTSSSATASRPRRR